VHPFFDMKPRTTCSTVKVTAINLKKRKKAFLTNPYHDGVRKKKRKDQSETQVLSVSKELCGICKTVVTSPRATSCHHIFCKLCIKQSCQRCKKRRCPLCDTDITSKLIRYDPENIAFKPVEALDMNTIEIVKSYSSASVATLDNSEFVPYRIIEACQVKKRDDRGYCGYYWRFKDGKDRILRSGEGINKGVPIEQVDLETGNVIQVFSSSRKAYEETGISRSTIRRVLERRGNARARGYFWRYKGETHAPWPDPEPKDLQPVEKIDFKNGKYLESFASLAEAKRAMGMRSNSSCIRDVCNGKGRATAQGFFWRWKGSLTFPNHLRGVQKIIQLRKTKRGRVVKEFRSARDAQTYFRHALCWSSICRFCREKKCEKGYFWQYKQLSVPKTTEEKFVGKRLRVRKRDEGWIEGRINAFINDTGNHEIIYDCGFIERVALRDLQYEWKNDNGQKAIEKLDLKTGKVLQAFSSITEAAASVGGIKISSIVAVCKGKYLSSSGFFWRYKGANVLPTSYQNKRKVQQLCLTTGLVINTFESIATAAKAVGINSSGISYICNGNIGHNSAGGFGWKFKVKDA